MHKIISNLCREVCGWVGGCKSGISGQAQDDETTHCERLLKFRGHIPFEPECQILDSGFCLHPSLTFFQFALIHAPGLGLQGF
jgi:hypothetical protein